MLKILLSVFCFITLTFHSNLYSQGLEEDITVLYMKANVLYESGRYDEAVRLYNRILAEDNHYILALYMRAKAKFELGAYRGTKNDVLEFIDQAGITKGIIHLMAKTEYRLSNFRSANNYILTALELDEYDGALYLMAGDISMATDNKNDACERYAKGAQLGHNRSQEKLNSDCRGIVLTMTESKMSVDTAHVSESLDSLSNDNVETPGPQEESSISMPSVDLSAEQNVEIDTKLNLTVTNGLGERNIEFTPNIFMLSTEDGEVVIDVCVNEDGKVTSSRFNPDQSSIFRSSLTSLALRKAREFIFIPSLRAEQCGSIIYHIKS